MADPLILIAIQEQTSRQNVEIYKAKWSSRERCDGYIFCY